jgi:acid phosphatase
MNTCSYFMQESCESYSSTTGSDEQQEFINVYAPGVAKRLNGLVGGSAFNWTAMDVYAAQSLCGYDTVIRNMSISGFCNLFSENEWLDYEYGRRQLALLQGTCLTPPQPTI